MFDADEVPVRRGGLRVRAMVLSCVGSPLVGALVGALFGGSVAFPRIPFGVAFGFGFRSAIPQKNRQKRRV